MLTGKDRIHKYLQENGPATVSTLNKELFLSRQIIHRHLNSLIASGLVSKTGISPKVFYSAVKKIDTEKNEILFKPDKKTAKILEENFLSISPEGKRIHGIAGFSHWCKERDFNVYKKAIEYIKLYEKYEGMRVNDFFDGSEKLETSFKKICLDKLLYIDFYAWEIFGKTKLGQLLLYSKQSQNRKMISELSISVKDKIIKLIGEEGVDAIGFIPPTVKREIQFMKVFEKTLNLSLPVIKVTKIHTEVTVPQKTLAKLQDRIKNADATIAVEDTRKFKKLLLIDDSVGSGSTLNQTACKIKKANVAKKIIGLSITGSIMGFDVISEV